MSNRYEITSLLDDDYLGNIFLALDVTLQRKVVFRKFNSKSDVALPDEFKQYTGKLCALQHPNLLTIYDIDSNEEGYYMVTQFIEAELLSERLKLGVLDQTGVYNMAADLLDAFHAVHAMDLHHGALRSDSVNRLERARGGHRYLIVDLGLDKMGAMFGAGAKTTKEQVMLLAPELLVDDAHANAQSDLFALGQLCYLSLVGDHPMAGKSRDECAQAYRDGEMPHLKEYPIEVQEDFADWIMGMILSDPSKRPASSDEAMASLHAIQLNVPLPNVPGVTQAVVEVAPHVPPQASQPITVADESPQPVAPLVVTSAPKKNRMMIIGGAAVLSLIVIICVMVFRGGGDGSESGDDLAISGDGPVFLLSPSMVCLLKDEGKPIIVNLDTSKSLDWTFINGVPTSFKKTDKNEGAYITSISNCGEYKEFKMSQAPICYSGNGVTTAPKGSMTNVDKGSAEFGEGWEIMLRIPKKHSGPMKVTLYMLDDRCDFALEIKIHDTNEVIKLKVPYDSVGSIPGIVKIPLYIKEPTSGGFYTIKVLASSEKRHQAFGMGLSAVLVEKN